MKLMNLYQKNKLDRVNNNKNRYDDLTEKNKYDRDFHQSRLQQAQAKEEAMMARLQSTLQE